MNTILKQALVGVIRMVIGTKPWEKIREAVTLVSKNTDIPGEEKRAVVIAAMKEQGWTMASHLLNLAIEVAVAALVKKVTEIEKT